MKYDLVIKGGRVLDASQGIDGPSDVAFSAGKVAAVRPNLPEDEASEVVDASGLIVTPGLIDLHTHAYWGASGFGIPPDPGNIAKGVTTTVDAGSAGSRNFTAFRRHIIERADTRVLALLNISTMGMVGGNDIGELEDIRWADAEATAKCWRENRDIVVGIKARMGIVQAAQNAVEGLKRAIEASEAVGGFVMIHVGNTPAPLEELCAMLRPGDVVTHSFGGFSDVLIGEDGKVRAGLKEAKRRGVLFDVGHGGGGFSFTNAERAMADGFFPDNISSDLHNQSIEGPVYDLLTTMSKFVHLGMSVPDVVRLTTQTAARIIDRGDSLGTLAVGAEGDAAILRLEDGAFPMTDRLSTELEYHGVSWEAPVTVEAKQRLSHVSTVRAGRVYRPWLR